MEAEGTRNLLWTISTTVKTTMLNLGILLVPGALNFSIRLLFLLNLEFDKLLVNLIVFREFDVRLIIAEISVVRVCFN